MYRDSAAQKDVAAFSQTSEWTSRPYLEGLRRRLALTPLLLLSLLLNQMQRLDSCRHRSQVKYMYMYMMHTAATCACSKICVV